MTGTLPIVIHWVLVALMLGAAILATYFIRWAREFGTFFTACALNRSRTPVLEVWTLYHDEWGLRTEVFLFLKWAIVLRSGLFAWFGTWLVLVVTGAEPFVDRDLLPDGPTLAAKLAAFGLAGFGHAAWVTARHAADPEYKRSATAPEETLIRQAITGD